MLPLKSLFVSPCPPQCYLQSEMKIEPDLRLLCRSPCLNLWCFLGCLGRFQRVLVRRRSLLVLASLFRRILSGSRDEPKNGCEGASLDLLGQHFRPSNPKIQSNSTWRLAIFRVFYFCCLIKYDLFCSFIYFYSWIFVIGCSLRIQPFLLVPRR